MSRRRNDYDHEPYYDPYQIEAEAISQAYENYVHDQWDAICESHEADEAVNDWINHGGLPSLHHVPSAPLPTQKPSTPGSKKFSTPCSPGTEHYHPHPLD